MDSLVLMVEPNDDGRSFDLITAQLIDAMRDSVDEKSMLFELNITARYAKLQGDQVASRIEGLIKSHVMRLATSLDTQLKQRRNQ